MDAFSHFMKGLFGFADRQERYVPPDLGDEGYRDRFFTRQHQDDDQYDDFPWFESRSGRFPGFPPNFDEFRQHMDQTFDELFKIFGNDSMPMFDPFRPPTSDVPTLRQGEDNTLPVDGNVRDRMLRQPGESIQNGDDTNVRSHMLRRDPANPYYSSRGHGPRSDINWDSLLKEGGSVHDILDNSKPESSATPPSSATKPSPSQGSYSFFKYSSITRTRKPDGTIETRRVTRDADGNEKEIVEITKS